MQGIHERRTYAQLGSEIDKFRTRLTQNNHFSIPQLQSASDALEALLAAIATQRQQNLCVADVFIAIRNHMAFWRTTEFPADILDAIHHNLFVSDTFGTMPERYSWCDYLAENAQNLFVLTRQINAAKKLDGLALPDRITAQSAHIALIDSVTLRQEAAQNGFVTEAEQTRFRPMLLKHWLSLQMTENSFSTVEPSLLAVINAEDNERLHQLRSFAEIVQINNPVTIDTTFYDTLDVDAIAFLRMKAIERLINAQNDLTIIQQVIHEEEDVYKLIPVINIEWMTAKDKNVIKKIAEARLFALEHDPAKKAVHKAKLGLLIDNFMGLALNQRFYSLTQCSLLKTLFNFCTATQQKIILEKIQWDPNRFLAQVFHAKTPDALRFYLGLESASMISNDHLSVLTQYNHKGEVINGELVKYFTDHGIDFNPVTLNRDLARCYRRLGSYQQNAIPKFEQALARHIQTDHPHLLDLTQPLKSFLKKSAKVFNQIRLTNFYKQNHFFCNYLLSIPGFSVAIRQSVPPRGKLSDEVLKLINIFQKAHTLDTFKQALADVPSALRDSFAFLQESEFRELKNKTLEENLKHAGNPNDKERDSTITQIIKRGHEQIFKPLRDDFRQSQIKLLKLSNRMLEVRKLIRADMGVRQVASSHKDALKCDLLQMIKIGQIMEQKLSRDITRLDNYQKTILAAAKAGNIATPALQKESEKAGRYIHELEIARSAWKKFRENTGLITNQELKILQEKQPYEAHHSIYGDITSAERESARAEGPRFPFTARKTTIKAVPIANYPEQNPPEKNLTNKVIGNREKYSLTKKKDYVPALKPGEMHEMRIPYIDKRNPHRTVEQTLILTKKPRGNGRFTIALRTPPLCKEGELELISKAEWAITSQKPGNTFELCGDEEYLVKMYTIFIKLDVPASLIDMKHASIYNPKNPSTRALEVIKAFTSMEGFQERIDESKKRLDLWRKNPAAYIHNRGVKAKDLMKGIFADTDAQIRAEDRRDYTAPAPAA